MNNMAIPRTGSPNINRTNSPASVAHSRVASRTNSIGASSMNPAAGGGGSTYNRPSSNSLSSGGGQSTPSTNNVQVKAEPVDRFLPGPAMPSSQPTYPNYNPGMSHIQIPPNMNLPGGIPNLSSFGNIPNLNMNALNTYGATRGVPGYGSSAGNGPSDSRSILMLPRGAAPYNPAVASAAAGGTNGVTKMPQLDGTWDEEDESTSRSKREWLMRRYPWMAEAQIHMTNLAMGEEQMPQVDGPTPATPPVPPLNLLPPLNLGSSSNGTGLNRDGAPPPLTLPPLNLPPLGGSSQAGSRALHPSLMNNPSVTVVEVKRDSPPPGSLLNAAQAGPSSSFARNPNVPAQPSEDINSDLDDTDDEDGPQEQPGSDPDADVTYCTYDKASCVSLDCFCCRLKLGYR
jgi:hypothetical protein